MNFSKIKDRLFTSEDSYFFHKFFGFTCLVNFVLQYIYYFSYGVMFEIQKTIFLHIFLHISSFIFHVVKFRPSTSSIVNMFIWEELRLHSMIFSYRACFTILFPEYSKHITYLTMMLADVATYYFGSSNMTTVRGSHEKESKSLFKKIAAIYFSTSQMGATILCSGCFQNSFSNILVFSTLIPIQTSAFGLTLLRKSLISKVTWQVIYSFELGLIYILWYYIYRNLYIIPLSIAPYIFRRLGLSKYIIWLVIFLIDSKINSIQT